MTQPYHWNSEDYARHSAGQYRWAQIQLERLQLQPGQAVLDIGCGDGKVTAQLAARAAPGLVLGVDRSSNMLRLAYQTHRPGHPNLYFCQQDAAHLALVPAFDVAFSNATLHWVADHPAVLRGVQRALRPGGRLVFEMGGAGNAAGIIVVLNRVIDSHPWQDYFDCFNFPYYFASPQEYAHWLPQAGLKLARAELVEKDMQHAGSSGLAGWIRTTWLPYLARVPEQRQAEFIDTVVARYLQTHPLDESGIAHVAMMRLEVEAVKE